MFNKSQKLFSISLLLAVFLFVLAPLSPVFSAEPSRFDNIKSGFSDKLDTVLKASAVALDRSIVKLFESLNKTDVLTVKVHSHFYDAKIRRYFISFSGTGTFKGKLPAKLTSREYLISCDKEVSYDISITDIRRVGRTLKFKYEGAMVFSLDRISYKLMKSVPHFAASGALAPAARLLTHFLEKLNIGILSEAISETLRSFSTVAISRTGAELLNAAGNNKKLKIVIKSAMKDGSIISFMGMGILKCAAGSLVNVAGASLGSAVGSMIAPGPGSVIGAYIGSQILSQIAATVIYKVTVKMPIIRDLKKIQRSHEILKHNKGDYNALKSYNESMKKVQKKVFKEFNSDKFKLFKLILNRIDKYAANEREAFVPLLKKFQEKLLFKVINDGDWYFAKFYHQLKVFVEKWKLEKQISFTTDPRILNQH